MTIQTKIDKLYKSIGKLEAEKEKSLAKAILPFLKLATSISYYGYHGLTVHLPDDIKTKLRTKMGWKDTNNYILVKFDDKIEFGLTDTQSEIRCSRCTSTTDFVKAIKKLKLPVNKISFEGAKEWRQDSISKETEMLEEIKALEKVVKNIK